MTLALIVIIAAIIINACQKQTIKEKETEYKNRTKTNPALEANVRKEWEDKYREKYNYIDPDRNLEMIIYYLHDAENIPWAPSWFILCQGRDYNYEEIQKRFFDRYWEKGSPQYDTIYDRIKDTSAYRNFMVNLVEREVSKQGYAYGGGHLSEWQEREERRKGYDSLKKKYPWL